MRFVLSNNILFFVARPHKVSLVQWRKKTHPACPSQHWGLHKYHQFRRPFKAAFFWLYARVWRRMRAAGGSLCTLQSDSLSRSSASNGFGQRVPAFTSSWERVNFIERKVGALMVHIKTTIRNIGRAADFREDSCGELFPADRHRAQRITKDRNNRSSRRDFVAFTQQEVSISSFFFIFFLIENAQPCIWTRTGHDFHRFNLYLLIVLFSPSTYPTTTPFASI